MPAEDELRRDRGTSLLTLDHESGCRNMFEGTLRRFTAYRIAIRLYLWQNALPQKP
jgi:hypothetical protein